MDIPWKLISLLGWMIWPRNGKNTNGIFSDDDPLTNGANVHSVTRNKKESKWKRNIRFLLNINIYHIYISKIHAFFLIFANKFFNIYFHLLRIFIRIHVYFHAISCVCAWWFHLLPNLKWTKEAEIKNKQLTKSQNQCKMVCHSKRNAQVPF